MQLLQPERQVGRTGKPNKKTVLTAKTPPLGVYSGAEEGKKGVKCHEAEVTEQLSACHSCFLVQVAICFRHTAYCPSLPPTTPHAGAGEEGAGAEAK